MKKYDGIFRSWHWVNAILMFGVFITVLLRETFLNKHNVADILLQKLSSLHLSIDEAQAITIAKAIREPMWQWHIYLGLAIFVLWIVRMFLFGSVSGKINYMHLKDNSFHKLVVKLGYLGVYVAIFVISVTGIAITYHDSFGITKEFVHNLKELHEVCFYILLAFTPLHIIGVVVAENRDEKGIVSDMINGGRLADS
jgi:cytochrome b561